MLNPTVHAGRDRVAVRLSGRERVKMIVEVSGKCAFEQCDKPAEFIACGRATHIEDEPGHPTPACYCREHMVDVISERYPEYVDTCPNCGCTFGVN
jgi:hypothetical protein